MIVDQLQDEIQEAKLHEVIGINCTFRRCENSDCRLVSLVFEGGDRKIYGICGEHLQMVRGLNPRVEWRKIEQSEFIYA